MTCSFDDRSRARAAQTTLNKIAMNATMGRSGHGMSLSWPVPQPSQKARVLTATLVLQVSCR